MLKRFALFLFVFVISSSCTINANTIGLLNDNLYSIKLVQQAPRVISLAKNDLNNLVEE